MKLNYRNIPALLPKRYTKIIKKSIFKYHLRDFLLVSLILIALFQLQILVLLNGEYKKDQIEYQSKIDNFRYWQEVSEQFPNIPDILYNASLSAFNAGNKTQALEYVEKALIIDPLFERASNLKKEIIKS